MDLAQAFWFTYFPTKMEQNAFTLFHIFVEKLYSVPLSLFKKKQEIIPEKFAASFTKCPVKPISLGGREQDLQDTPS